MDDRVEKLRSRFINKKIVVYGTGINAKCVVSELRSVHIIGILDGLLEQGTFNGYRIMTVDEAVKLHPDAIIIAAQLSSVLLVYQRIHNICRHNMIALLDMWGNDLLVLMNELEEQKTDIYRKNFLELKREIDCHEVISFDVFDTLIMRKTLYPMDVFDIIEKKAEKKGILVPDFGKMRADAEQSVDCISPNIYQIYDAYQQRQKISPIKKRMLLEMELLTEGQVLVRRESMIEAMDYALKSGKKVYLISDMYLPKELLSEFLHHLEIGGYEDLFVSCDYHQTKYTKLYKIFMDKYPAQSYLHIGDNIEADGFCAKAYGMDVYIIPSAYHLLQVSSYQEIIVKAHTLNERSMLGMILSRVFNDPFVLYNTDGRPYIDKVQDAVFLFMAPLILKMLLWLTGELEKGRYDKVLFSARDGFLVQKLYRFIKEELALQELPKDEYFHASRALCALAGIKNEDDIMWMLSAPFDKSWKDVMIHRFALMEEELLKEDRNKYASILEYAMEHKEKIYARSKEVRKNYTQYMEGIGLKKGERYAFFDFVSCGTCQYFLSRYVPFLLEGLYCGYYDSVTGKKREIPIKSMYVNKDYFQKETVFFKNYLLFEAILTSEDSSVIRIDNTGFPVFARETRNNHQLKTIHNMQEAVIEYVKEYISVLYVPGVTIHVEFVDKLFGLLALRYTNENCSEFNCVELMDDFGENRLEITRDQLQ